jgi:hypothetical protein
VKDQEASGAAKCIQVIWLRTGNTVPTCQQQFQTQRSPTELPSWTSLVLRPPARIDCTPGSTVTRSCGLSNKIHAYWSDRGCLQVYTFHLRNYWTQILSVDQRSAFLDWGNRRIAALAESVSRRKGCFIVHREHTQLLGINVCFQLLSQHNHRENEVMTITRTPILQTSQSWHNHLSNKLKCEVFFQNVY